MNCVITRDSDRISDGKPEKDRLRRGKGSPGRPNHSGFRAGAGVSGAEGAQNALFNTPPVLGSNRSATESSIKRILGALVAMGFVSTNTQAAENGVRYDSSGQQGLPFSRAVQVGEILYLSGQIGASPELGRLAGGGVPGQAKQAMENIGRVLTAHQLGFNDVFKCTVMLSDMSTWSEFNKVYVQYFKPDHLPVRSAFGATGLALGAALEIECWAHVPVQR